MDVGLSRCNDHEVALLTSEGVHCRDGCKAASEFDRLLDLPLPALTSAGSPGKGPSTPPSSDPEGPSDTGRGTSVPAPLPHEPLGESLVAAMSDLDNQAGEPHAL
jgi:hypothetical protein